MDEKGLGRLLQAARIKAGFTQQTLCQKAGLSYSTLTKIERGAIKAPSIFTIQHIAAALGVGLDELIGSISVQKQHSRSGVSFVYFDINGCLVRFFHGAFTRLGEITGAPADVIETTFWRYNDEICRGTMSMEEFDGILAKALGVSQLHWIDYYLEAIEPIKPMGELVQWISKNYQLGLLTNLMPGVLEVLKNRKVIPNVNYDAIVDSSVVGTMKPERKIYEIAAKAAGCPVSEILLVDDTRANLMAADKQGWHVLWFDEYRPGESIKRIRSALEPV
jgi:FMN phosphatase YigB (HAD superfamily)/DNA-binding Xre family transcriptional regulator